MMDATKYHVGYYPPPVEPGHVYEWPQKDHIEKAPAWCSVDLRDGNQSPPPPPPPPPNKFLWLSSTPQTFCSWAIELCGILW